MCISLTNLGRYTLDTLQIYFPWDDDFYTYFKNHGMGTANTRKKALPLIYTDNCESTTGVTEVRRNYVIRPDYFDKTYEQLGWTQTDQEPRPIIPAEKIQAQVHFYKITTEPISSTNPIVKFVINPTVNGKEEYHLEYSAMSAFGKMYSNWVTFYFTLDDFKIIIAKLIKKLKYQSNSLPIGMPIQVEEQQAQREELTYVELPVKYYKFSIGEFQYAFDYLRYNGVQGDIPSLVYNSTNPQHNTTMSPLIKFGIVHTQASQGFWQRPPQIVMKIAQPMVTVGTRIYNGKRVNIKKKGEIIIDNNFENYFLVDAKTLCGGYFQLKNRFTDEL